MKIVECYQALGGDYGQARKRLSSDQTIERFIAKFLDDTTYSQLCQAMDFGRREDAFRACQTLESISANLSFDRLFRSTAKLTRLLHPAAGRTCPDTTLLMQTIREDYRATVESIRQYLDSVAERP